MKPFRTLLSLLSLILPLLILTAPSLAAQSKLLPLNGTVMSAETNKPVVNASVSLYARTDKGLAPAPVATSTSDTAGRFRVNLEPGHYTWLVKAEGYGLYEGGLSVNAKMPEVLSAYLQRPASLSGRIVDGTGKAMPGISIAAGKWLSATSGADGRFTITGLNARGYEPVLRQPGFVLEKSAYQHFNAGETREIGDMTIRRAADLRVSVSAPDKGKKRQLDRIRLNLSGNSLYRSAAATPQGVATFADLPPGRYHLSISDERLTEISQEIEIAEGENKEVSLAATLRPPTLNIEEYGDVFLPEKALKLKAYGLWIEKAEAVISAINSTALIAGKVDLQRPDSIPIGALKKTAGFSVSFKSRRDSYTRNARVSIPALPPGGYLLELRSNGATTRFAFLVTRLGLVAKVSPSGTLLYATDLVTGQALPGVEVVSQPSGKRAVSGPDGLVPWSNDGKYQRLAGRIGTSLAFLNLASGEGGQRAAAMKGYVYTDRPAYRPGQTVYFKGVVRQRSGEGYTLPGLEKVQIKVSDNGDKAICESMAEVTATGSFNGKCTLPATPVLGGYTISASGNGESWQGWFQVLEYRKPEFEVKLTPDRRFLVAGDTARMRLSARYYFGAPVAGAKATWRVYTQPAWGLGKKGEEPEDSDDGEDSYSRGYSDFIGEGEVRLDANGEAVIPVSAKTHDMPFTYTMELDVTDVSSRQVSSSATVAVVPSLIALNVKADSYLAKPGNPVEVNLRSSTWEGSPKAVPVSINFERQVYDKKSRSYSWVSAETIKTATMADGAARIRFSFPHSGFWQIKGETADEAGRKSVATAYVWVWKEGNDWEGSYRQLEAEFDRKSYKPGETARLIVRSPATGGNLLLTLEGRDIQSRRTVPLKSMVEVVELPVTEAYAPVIHVSVVAVQGGRFFSRTLLLRVDHQPGKLGITIKPEKLVYAPGDTVRLTVSSKAAGKPVPAELSLAVVDEAIFAVAPERKDDIYQFFRGTREHLVTTLHSFPRVYLGGASKDAKTFQAEDSLKGLKIRKVFKDMAAWFPMLTGNADGSATAEFVLPDNLTTWRATAVGHTADSDFGSAREKFIARLDLMARLSPPRFFTVGDELRIPGIITSMTDAQQSATGRFEAVGLSLLGETTFNGNITPRGTLRRDISVRADSAGRGTLRLLAQGAAGGDAMELTLPVLPRGIKRTTGGGIALREQEGTTELNLPENVFPGSAELKLDFAPTITTSLNSAISRLVEFPYGCVEQTLSRFIPAVHARALLAKQSWKPEAAIAEKLPLVIAEGMKRLEEMQHEDGGWGWWKDDPTRLTMTAHALYGLGLAKRAGLDVSPEMVQRGMKSLEMQMGTALVDELPRAYRAYTINGGRNEGLEQKIRTAWKTLPTAEQLAFAEALSFAGRREDVLPLIAQLKEKAENEGNAAFIRDAAAESWWYGWRWGSSVVETTSTLLSLVAKESPTDPLAPKLAEFLARRRNGGWWQTTTSSAAAVTALADYVATSGEATATYSARLYLNDREIGSYRVVNGALKEGPEHLAVPAASLATGTNNLKLIKDGNGAAYLSATLDYVVPPESAASSPGLKLERTLYRVSSVKDGDRWRREYTQLTPAEKLAPGDDIEVRLTVDTAKALDYVIIEDRLPSGFESRETDRDPRFSDESAYIGWFSHRERHDERLAFFISRLPAGRHQFRHVIYPELEGKIIALPAAVWPMYQPELRGESAPWLVEVGERK